jgi:hypothetical protein
VVACDDGVMPQTRESIAFAKAAGVPLVVAMNKCDKENIDIAKVKAALLSEGVELEEAGGDVQAVVVSALQRLHLNTLEEAILMQAELGDLTAEAVGPAEGVIIEAKTSKGQGAVATMLVRRGELTIGAHMVAGTASCKACPYFALFGRVRFVQQSSALVLVLEVWVWVWVWVWMWVWVWADQTHRIAPPGNAESGWSQHVAPLALLRLLRCCAACSVAPLALLRFLLCCASCSAPLWLHARLLVATGLLRHTTAGAVSARWERSFAQDGWSIDTG